MEVAHHDHVSNIVNLCAFQGWIQESIKEGAEVDLSGGGGGGWGHPPLRKFSNSGLILLYSGQVIMQTCDKISYCTVAVVQLVVYNNQLY